jgi:hypothetical protein
VLRYRAAASPASYGFVLIPLITVPLSTWHDEPVTPALVLGGL